MVGCMHAYTEYEIYLLVEWKGVLRFLRRLWLVGKHVMRRQNDR
jgi:hypothetical protein